MNKLICWLLGHKDCYEREGYFKYRFRCKRCSRIIYDEPVDIEAGKHYQSLISGGWRKYLPLEVK